MTREDIRSDLSEYARRLGWGPNVASDLAE